MSNEYLDRFTEIGGAEDGFIGGIDKLTEHWLDDFEKKWDQGIKPPLMMRRELTVRYAWAVPTDEAIEMIAKHSPIVEMGAGTGYWASLLVKAGAGVVAYDSHPPGPGGEKNGHGHTIRYHRVWRGEPSVLCHHGDCSLFLCWPPYNEPMASAALSAWKGETLIYIGEDHGGCTADDRFFAVLERDFEEVNQCPLPQWWGIHDSLTIYRRKMKPKTKRKHAR